MSFTLDLALRLGAFHSGESGPPFYSDLLFYSKSREGGDVVNKIDETKNATLIVDPTIDIVNLDNWDIIDAVAPSTFKTVVFQTVNGPETYNVISSVTDLYNIRLAPALNYIMDDNINLDVAPYNTGDGWLPSTFAGHLNGNGYSINSLYINRPTTRDTGLFSVISNSIISNLNIIVDVIISGDYTGAICGEALTSSIYNCSSICLNQATPTTPCISGVTRAGGLVGELKTTSTMNNCYSGCNVTASSYRCGGLIGIVNNANIVTNCYSYGYVYSPSQYGGLIGYTLGDPSTITNSFWDTETSGKSTSVGGTGKTTAEMQTQSTFTDAGWDFTDTWTIESGEYPHLLVEDKIGFPISVTKIIANEDGWMQMPSDVLLEIAPSTFVPAFNKANTIIYNSDCRDSGYWQGQGEDQNSPLNYLWHISELENHTIFSYTNAGYQYFFFVKVKYVTGTATVQNVVEILSYSENITDTESLTKIYKYIGYDIWNDSAVWNDDEIWID